MDTLAAICRILLTLALLAYTTYAAYMFIVHNVLIVPTLHL